MTWFKVDDGFYSSKKVLSIPRSQRLAAVGLWTMAGNWSARELSDGCIPAYVLDELGATPKLRQALITARLWLDQPDGGVEFANWAEYQPSRASVEETREKNRQKQEAYRKRNSGVTGEVTGNETGESPGQSQAPDPTRPDPTPSSTKKGGAAKRGTRIDAAFSVTPEMRSWANRETPLVDIDGKLAAFVDYWTGVPGQKGLKLDWVATWRNDMRKKQEFAERDAKLSSPAKTDWMNR